MLYLTIKKQAPLILDINQVRINDNLRELARSRLRASTNSSPPNSRTHASLSLRSSPTFHSASDGDVLLTRHQLLRPCTNSSPSHPSTDHPAACECPSTANSQRWRVKDVEDREVERRPLGATLRISLSVATPLHAMLEHGAAPLDDDEEGGQLVVRHQHTRRRGLPTRGRGRGMERTLAALPAGVPLPHCTIPTLSERDGNRVLGMRHVEYDRRRRKGIGFGEMMKQEGKRIDVELGSQACAISFAPTICYSNPSSPALDATLPNTLSSSLPFLLPAARSLVVGVERTRLVYVVRTLGGYIWQSPSIALSFG
ncbi:hypothetical protein BDN71DRAFT_1509193 [Pleurotus eryngii]|uniref:Uncharacterized protein n=1 Tax=Pleurotus eryngii TaxID=5323 RepID=A0A9P6DE32_PLEER|nr:hypothetical protein BDN71DRAFT_1509193 [Pleurotus eryngii]